MALDLSLIEHPQIQNAPPPIGCPPSAPQLPLVTFRTLCWN
jgi:hypothetical protein